MTRLTLLLFTLLCCLTTGFGQLTPPPASLVTIPVYALPRQDNAQLLTDELSYRKPGRAPTFAVSLPVDLAPEMAGQWSVVHGRARWVLRIRSNGAKSLNLGFSRYALPQGAELYLSTTEQRYGPFTAADNEDHNQFWSPLLEGDELLLELYLPGPDRQDSGLHLTTVNHDFEGVSKLLSEKCNIDVACSGAEGFDWVDGYRDVIRSVGAYTLNGRSQCTGFLVNNVNQDGRPLFLTADHCDITAENAASLVVYWNYQQRECRTPGSVASGAKGNGTLSIFNSGAALRAHYDSTDFSLVELDEPVNPLADAFFAGWSAEAPPPADGVVCVHHPGVDEKRISRSEQATVLANNRAEAVPRTGKFVKVASWTDGSTQGGSSGAPLFDREGRARGHLLGGLASCNSDDYDLFGYFNQDWEGGGSTESRLRDWLDPCGTDLRSIDGLEQADLPFLLSAQTYCLTQCTGSTANYTVYVGEGFPTGSTVSIESDPRLTITAPTTTSGGESFLLSVSGPVDLSGEFELGVTVSLGSTSDFLPLQLRITGAAPLPPVLIGPSRNVTTVSPFPTLSWQSTAGATGYRVELATAADFSSLAGSYKTDSDTAVALRYPLSGATTYYWRVRAVNSCGDGAWSVAASFTTAELSCILPRAAALPVAISTVDSVQVVATLEVTEALIIASLRVQVGIDHSFVGDIEAALISPAGTVIRLFDPPLKGVCTAENVYTIFADEAAQSAGAFARACRPGDRTAYTTAQPLDPLSALLGESALGTWQLRVTDRAPLDGGAITDFQLQLCAQGSDTRALAVGLTSPDIRSCSNNGGTASLQLGSDYTPELNLRVTAGDLPLDNYTYTYDPVGGQLAVTFTAWTLVGPGTYPLTYTVIGEDGTERSAVSTLTVDPIPQAIEPLNVRTDSLRSNFTWATSSSADIYTLEVAEGGTFDDILYSATTLRNRISVFRDSLPRVFFWRVLSANSCGTFTGPGRAGTNDITNATRELTPGATISIYPNPTRGPLTVEVTNLDNQPLSAKLFDAAGRAQRQWSRLSLRQQLDLEGLPPGVYYLRIQGSTAGLTEKIMLFR